MDNAAEPSSDRQSRPGPWLQPGTSADADLSAASQTYGGPGARSDGQLGRGLAWFSIAVGLAYLMAPRAMARSTGMPYWPLMLRATGVRELACGVGLLTQGNTSPLLRYSRVAGDAMDLAMLGASVVAPGGSRRRLAAAAALVAGVSVLDVLATRQRLQGLARQTGPAQLPFAQQRQGVQRIDKSVTVNKPAEECYRMWRDLEGLPRFMEHLESVHVTGERLSHWRATAPLGSVVEWDAELTDDKPGQLLAWRSMEGSDVEHTGSVSFAAAPAGRGTVIRVQMQYQPPAGKAGAIAAKVAGADPERAIDQALRRSKQLIETGEVTTTKGQSAGRRSLKARLFNKGAEQ